jgi:ParB family chromosome partitioning protein
VSAAVDQVLERVALADVIVDVNVRTDIKLDKSFVSSIRNHGILQPPIGWRGDDGKVRITAGQRRTLAALELELGEIDVIIKPQEIAEAARIVTQLTENDQRQELTESERVFGYKQLAMFGVSADQIARKTNKPKAHVVQALAVAGSDVAVDAIEKHELTLDQAAVLVEFQDNNKAIAELQQLAAERPEMIEHRAQQWRSQIARERHGQSVADKASADGWTVTYRGQYDYGIPNGHQRVTDLWRSDDPTKTKLTLDDVKDSPGRVVLIDVANARGDEAQVTWLIKDHKKHGYEAHSDAWSTSAGKGPLSEEEKEARRQKRIDKAEMIDATVVRRSWIRDVLLAPGRKKWPDDAIAWLTGSLWHAATHPRDSYSDAIRFTAEHLLGTPFEYSSKAHPKNPDTGEYFRTIAEGDVHVMLSLASEPMRYALAISVGRVEELAGNPKAVGFGQDLRIAAYLRQLRDWGYTLADVEQRIVDAADKNRKRRGAKL